jgi:hypothetical protein
VVIVGCYDLLGIAWRRELKIIVAKPLFMQPEVAQVAKRDNALIILGHIILFVGGPLYSSHIPV